MPGAKAARGFEVNQQDKSQAGARSARMPMQSTVLLSHGADAWTTDIEDISASGVLVRKPDGWAHRIGALFALDMMIGPELNIHLEARSRASRPSTSALLTRGSRRTRKFRSGI